MRPDPIGDRMKGYEDTRRLPRRTWTIIRVDGRAFHSYCRGLARPYDSGFMADMDAVMLALCVEVSGAAFGYVQSDEVSVLATDFATPTTQPWFGGVTAKVVSLAAATATAALNQRRPGKRALFDARAFTVDTAEEAAGYFAWRQADCERNSVSMAAQAQFSHRALQGVNVPGMRDMLAAERGIDWHDYPAGFKWGRVAVKEASTEDVSYVRRDTGETHTETVTRSRWVAREALRFDLNPGGRLLADLIPQRPADVPAASVADGTMVG